MDNKDIQYIAEHYKSGRFSTDKAWSAMGFRRLSWWTRSRVAAVIAIAVGLTASAAIVITTQSADDKAQPAVNVSRKDKPKQKATVTLPLTEVVRVIDFEDAALPEVIKKIKEVYGVEIENNPANASDYRLSLHYEGNVEDLVATINEILDINLSVKKQ